MGRGKRGVGEANLGLPFDTTERKNTDYIAFAESLTEEVCETTCQPRKTHWNGGGGKKEEKGRQKKNTAANLEGNKKNKRGPFTMNSRERTKNNYRLIDRELGE